MLSIPSTVNPKNWVALHADYLYAFALTRLGDEELAREVIQETFLAALERLSSFEGRSSERTWLTAILKYKIIDVYRSKSRLATVVSDGFTNGTEFFDPDLNNWKREYWPEPFGFEDNDPIQNKELKLVLQNCMKRLPPLWLALFTMKHIDDESAASICVDMKVTDSNFWVIMHRAKVNLRACIQKIWN